MDKKILKILIATNLICSIASIALAQADYGLSPQLNKAVENLKTILRAVGFAITVVFIMFGGYKILTAGGSVEAVDTGRRWIMYAIGGLAVVLVAEGIAALGCYIGTGGWSCK
jgi:ABC-type arginine transport system permease subunit